jgi:hypothetical protein
MPSLLSEYASINKISKSLGFNGLIPVQLCFSFILLATIKLYLSSLTK